MRVQACVHVRGHVPAPAVHADAVPAAKRTSEVGDSMDVGESAEKGAAISRGGTGVTGRDSRFGARDFCFARAVGVRPAIAENVARRRALRPTMAHDACAISHLLELHDDLLTNCAAQAAHAATLCRLSQSCKAFERLVLRDSSSAELVWAPALAHARLLADGSSNDGRATDGARTTSDGSDGSLQQEAIVRPSAALYRALATVELRWERAGLDVAGPQSLIKMALTGRTGGALCRLRGQLLLYGGTLVRVRVRVRARASVR